MSETTTKISRNIVLLIKVGVDNTLVDYHVTRAMLPNQYNMTNLKRALSNPRMLMGEIADIAERVNQQWWRRTERTGISVMDQDWDILIILDACRYDTFADLVSFPGKLSAVRSLGSDSQEFMQHNFCGRSLHDTVYVTANPYAEIIPDGTFHTVTPVYADEWDDDAGVVPPATMTEIAIETRNDYPQKRLIYHYMQPHAPHLGEWGAYVEQNKARHQVDDSRSLWTNLRYGLTDVSLDDARRAYRENLTLVLDELDTLLDQCDEKIAITADHGQLFGERLRPIPVQGYGHPPNIRVDPLVVVPWFECRYETRRDTVADPPERSSHHDVEEKLAALGYQ